MSSGSGRTLRRATSTTSPVRSCNRSVSAVTAATCHGCRRPARPLSPGIGECPCTPDDVPNLQRGGLSSVRDQRRGVLRVGRLRYRQGQQDRDQPAPLRHNAPTGILMGSAADLPQLHLERLPDPSDSSRTLRPLKIVHDGLDATADSAHHPGIHVWDLVVGAVRVWTTELAKGQRTDLGELFEDATRDWTARAVWPDPSALGGLPDNPTD